MSSLRLSLNDDTVVDYQEREAPSGLTSKMSLFLGLWTAMWAAAHRSYRQYNCLKDLSLFVVVRRSLIASKKQSMNTAPKGLWRTTISSSSKAQPTSISSFGRDGCGCALLAALRPPALEEVKHNSRTSLSKRGKFWVKCNSIAFNSCVCWWFVCLALRARHTIIISKLRL